MGHLGSAADRAAQSIMIVEKDKERNCYILKPEYLRSADDFAPIAIHYNKSLEQWEQTDYMEEGETENMPRKGLRAMPHDFDEDAHRNEVRKIFARQPYQKYDVIIQNMVEVYAQSRDWCRKCLKYLTEQGMIYYTVDGYTNEQQAKLFIATKWTHNLNNFTRSL